jgi:hypothetical protein
VKHREDTSILQTADNRYRKLNHCVSMLRKLLEARSHRSDFNL